MPRTATAVSCVAVLASFALTGCGVSNEPRHRAVNLARDAPAMHPAVALRGEWLIDLRPTPDAEPYLQPFSVTDLAGNQFEGTFYGGAPISSGYVNTDWEGVHFAFVTSDGSGAYHHAGRMTGPDTIEGSTMSVGREFLAVWSGTRAPESAEGGE